MSEPRYIHVRNWERFQHYKKRGPVWIKVYTELLSDHAFLTLTENQQLLLVKLWLLYAKTGRTVLESTAWLSQQLGQRVTKQQLEALNHAGFITLSASTTLAERYHDASPETETETEGPKELGKRRAVDADPGPADEIVTEQGEALETADLPPVGPGISPAVREHVLKVLKGGRAA